MTGHPKIFGRTALLPGLVFLAVATLRLISASQLVDSPWFLPTGGDTSFYHEWAKKILSGQWTDGQAFYGLPGYSFWLAICYKLLGINPYTPAFLQCIAEGALAALLFNLARNLIRESWDERSFVPDLGGVVAGLSWGLFVPAQAYSIILMPTAFACLAWWAVVAASLRGPRTWWGWLLLGLAIGLMATMVATLLLLLPLVLWAALEGQARPRRGSARAKAEEARTEPFDKLRALSQPKRPRPPIPVHPAALRVTAIVLVLAGVALGTAPCWVHNRFVARDPVFLSAHSGLNFYLGNHALANGYPRIPAGLRAGQAGLLKDSIRLAETAAGRPLKKSEVSDYWAGKARGYIREHPGEWIRLLCVKAANFWHAFRYDDLSIVALLWEEGILFPGPGFGPVAMLGLAGMLLTLGSRDARRISLAVLLLMLALMPVFITERYRLPAAPGMIVLGVAGLAQLAAWARDRRAGLFAAGLLWIAACGWIALRPQRDVHLSSVDDYNTGIAALAAGRLDLAGEKLERAYALVSDNSEIRFSLGNYWLERGDRQKAIWFYMSALEANPRHDGALSNLGALALEAGKFPEAEQLLAGALELEPDDFKTLYLLARAREGQGDVAGALAYVERALRLAPGHPGILALRDKLRSATPQIAPP